MDALRPPSRRLTAARWAAAVLAAALLTTGCSAATGGAATVRVYTSVTQDTVDAVLAAFHDAHPEFTVDVYRAPTGEIDARIAAERRSGGIHADVLWATDPLSVEQYDADGLLRAADPPNAASLPSPYRRARFWGTRILNVVLVAHSGSSPRPNSWNDLTDPAYRDAVALSDPGFAGSALGTIAYFALDDGYGYDYLRALAANGARQVQSVGDVITGVAEGQFAVGLALDKTVRDAASAGSPVELIWPSSGAIAMDSPIAIFDASANPAAAGTFVDFVLGRDAQTVIAATGWQPVRGDVPWDLTAGDQVRPDWAAAFSQRDQILAADRAIFGG